MKNNNKHILFISHDASMTGATLFLLTFVRWIKNNSNTVVSVLLLKEGPVSNEFKSISDNVWHSNLNESLIDKFVLILKRRYKVSIPFVKIKYNFDLVYCNTIATPKMGYKIYLKYGTKFLIHIHENDFTKNLFFNKWNSNFNNSAVYKYVAVSEFSKKVYVDKWLLPEDKITVINPFYDSKMFRNKIQKSAKSIKLDLDITSKYIVGSVGTTGWIKGVDYFIQVVDNVKNYLSSEEITFIWIGYIPYEYSLQIEFEIKMRDIKNIKFVDGSSSIGELMQLFDIYLLTSREESFSLSTLETGSLNIPTICFNGIGEIVNFVNQGTGISVEYGNIKDMAKAIADLCLNEEKRTLMGKKASLLSQEYDVEILAPKLFEIVDV